MKELKELTISEWPFFNVSPDDKLSRLTTGRISRANPEIVADTARDKLVAELDALCMAPILEKLQRAVAKEAVEALQGDIQDLAESFVSVGSATSSTMAAAVDFAALEARVACLVPSVILDAGHSHRAAMPAKSNANFGFGTTGHQAVRDTKSWSGYNAERNRAKKERRK